MAIAPAGRSSALATPDQHHARQLLALRADQKKTLAAAKKAIGSLTEQIREAYAHIALLTAEITVLRNELAVRERLHLGSLSAEAAKVAALEARLLESEAARKASEAERDACRCLFQRARREILGHPSGWVRFPNYEPASFAPALSQIYDGKY